MLLKINPYPFRIRTLISKFFRTRTVFRTQFWNFIRIPSVTRSELWVRKRVRIHFGVWFNPAFGRHGPLINTYHIIIIWRVSAIPEKIWRQVSFKQNNSYKLYHTPKYEYGFRTPYRFRTQSSERVTDGIRMKFQNWVRNTVRVRKNFEIKVRVRNGYGLILRNVVRVRVRVRARIGIS